MKTILIMLVGCVKIPKKRLAYLKNAILTLVMVKMDTRMFVVVLVTIFVRMGILSQFKHVPSPLIVSMVVVIKIRAFAALKC